METKTVKLYTRQNEKTLAQLERDGRIINNRTYVRVLENDIPEERDVTVGVNNGTEVEITGGLEVGEKLVV